MPALPHNVEEPTVAVLLVAHGSRRASANKDTELVAEELRRRGDYPIVEIGFLELAEPTIPQGAAACIAAGATEVRILPWFLSAGQHVMVDLDNFRSEFQNQYPGITFTVCPPLGVHPGMIDVLLERSREVLQNQD